MFPENLLSQIPQKSFLVTGGAGFIGSNLIGFLLKNNAKEVRVLDNFSTGYEANIQEFFSNPSFKLITGDITVFEDCKNATHNIDYVLHQAALGSVPRSIADPITTNNTNINGFLNMLYASVANKVKRFVYASSSSVYGNDTTMPKVEVKTGELLSPYAVTKKANELYADVFYKTYGLEVIGLRYFNVFGPKQNINGPYAAVIPIFINELLNKRSPRIFGDGSTTRDFTFIENVVQANLLAAMTENKEAINQVFNIAFGGTTSLNELFRIIAKTLNSKIQPEFHSERKGDIKDSFADISKAKNLLNYKPEVDIINGLKITVNWYENQL
ncbi:MAG: SDR family oxidoreductase [Bacteroidota bacterium]|nr:SDR family oxidoreductase [Bacteroidota bacterium]MDP3146163.1 SDR family oxidoreductase [Bacteroidota bacterium]MDP3556684.1 SDR family oxidoreductase [Bacteroidota bacterium]